MSLSGLRIPILRPLKLTVSIVPVALSFLKMIDWISANFQFFAKKGITLSSLVCTTHPSEPNYMAAVGGYVF
jgi:hypothetical protein